jgi:hypothetical protein
MSRRVAAALAAMLVLVAAALFVRAHGWNDIAVGTNTAYCGMHWQAGQHPFYCQSGR